MVWREPRNHVSDCCFCAINVTEINKRLTRSVYEDRLPPLKSIDLMVGALEPIAEGFYSRIMEAGDELRRGHQ